MDAKTIKDMAKELGADLVGIAPRERWEGLSAPQNPLTVMPECKSVIVVGRRVLRGALRGIEEGTNFSSTYHAYGAGWQKGLFLLRNVHNLACEIEKAGYEAMPLLEQENEAKIMPDFQQLAHLAGLGSMGKGGFFLTPQFGHRQRFGIILTTLELEGDAIAEMNFCENCDACLTACPLAAMKKSSDFLFERSEIRCANCKNGSTANGTDRIGASCGRACMIALEDKVGNRFENRFRKRTIWERDLENNVTLKSAGGKA